MLAQVGIKSLSCLLQLSRFSLSLPLPAPHELSQALNQSKDSHYGLVDILSDAIEEF